MSTHPATGQAAEGEQTRGQAAGAARRSPTHRTTVRGRLEAYVLPAAFVIYFGAFGGMLSGMSLRSLQFLSVAILVIAAIVLRRRLRVAAALPPLLAIAAAQLLALLTGPLSPDGVSQVVLLLATIAVYWVSTAADSETLDASVFAILVSVAFVALYQALNYWLRVEWPGLPPRLGSTLWNPNSLAFVLLLGCTLALKRQRWAALVLFVGTLLLTGSLTSFIAGIAGVVTYLVLAGIRRVDWRRILPLGAPVALIALVLFISQVVRRLNRQLEVSSFDQRLDLWRVATEMFARRPIIGMGPGSFKEIYFQTGLVVPGDTLQHAHNLYLHVAAETGLIGLAALAWLLVAAVAATTREWRRGKRHNGAAGAAMIVMVLLHGTFDYVYWIPSIILLTLWTAAALFYDESPARAPWRTRSAIRSGLLAAQVFLTGLLLFPITAELDAVREALARHTTALSLLLAGLILIVTPSRFRSKLFSRRLPGGAHVWRKPE